MTTTAIQRILNKTSWTGEELGKLEINIMADLFQQNIKGIKDPTPLIPLEQLQKMVQSITDKTQGLIFNGYLSIYEWITVITPCAEAMEQQAILRYQILERYLTTAILSEDVYRYSSSLPVIMTPEQLKEAKKNGVNNLVKDRTDSLALMLIRAIHYYSEQIEQNPEAKNLLTPLKKKYEKEKINSPYIKKNYNEVVGNGYYQLEDGRRSDQMSKEEWAKAINPTLLKEVEYMNTHNGKRNPETLERLMFRWKRKNSFVFNGLTEEMADALSEQEDIDAGRQLKAEWHYYPEAPENLTKWELLTDPHTLWKCYPNAFSDEAEPENYKAELQDFLEEFEEAIDIITKDIDKVCFKYFKLPTQQEQLIASMSYIPLTEWRECKISWEDLYNNDIYGMKAEAEAPELVFMDNPKALHNGVAIINKEDYREPIIENSFKEKTLEGFFTDNESYASNTKMVKTSKEVLAESYYYLKGFNKLIDMIADYYKIPDIVVFKCRMIDTVEAFIIKYNTLIPTLYGSIKNNFYIDKKLQERKLEALKDNFTPLNYQYLEVKEENLERVKASFKDFQAFNKDINKLSGNTDWLTRNVCVLPAEYYKGL